jgi:hypothetical protein
MDGADVTVWARQPGEPGRWYERFERFRLAGPGRALLPIYNGERERAGKGKSASPPAAWTVAAQRWRWRERAEAWDAHEQEERRRQDAADRARARAERVALLRAFQAKVARGLLLLDPESADPRGRLGWRTAVEALRMLVQELRAEYDDEPTRRVHHDGEVATRVIIREYTGVGEDDL